MAREQLHVGRKAEIAVVCDVPCSVDVQRPVRGRAAVVVAVAPQPTDPGADLEYGDVLEPGLQQVLGGGQAGRARADDREAPRLPRLLAQAGRLLRTPVGIVAAGRLTLVDAFSHNGVHAPPFARSLRDFAGAYRRVDFYVKEYVVFDLVRRPHVQLPLSAGSA